MKLLSVGGGSGGHVTPVVAVLKELRAIHPDVELRFWCDVHFAQQAASIVGAFDNTIPVETIASGKLRRYHHLNLWQHLMWPKLMWQNFVDIFKIIGGFFRMGFHHGKSTGHILSRQKVGKVLLVANSRLYLVRNNV